jgi:hypothetical protein
VDQKLNHEPTKDTVHRNTLTIDTEVPNQSRRRLDNHTDRHIPVKVLCVHFLENVKAQFLIRTHRRDKET